MAFFNVFMLLGALGIGIPILIHILNRKSAKKVLWGAMRFLYDSMVNRQRKIMIEELLIMVLRCLLILLLVLVAARPFITPGSYVSWFVVLPLLVIAVMAGASGIVLRPYRRLRKGFFAMSGVLLLAALAALFFEERLQSRISGLSGSRDLALVIDVSDTMLLKVGGATNFDRAVAEARNLIDEAPAGTSFSLVVAGGRPYAPFGSPVSDRDMVLRALEGITPGKGLARMPQALSLAAYTLAQGNNLSKEVFVFSDGRREGWELDRDAGGWPAVKESMELLSSTPPVILRRLGLPDPVRNAAVTGFSLSRGGIGIDRPVGIDVTVFNSGTEAVTPEGVALTVEGATYIEEAVGQIPPGATRTVRFTHKFETPGAHTVAAELKVLDEVVPDNRMEKVIVPQTRFPVLVVDARPEAPYFDRPSAFAVLALAPSPRTRRALDAEDNAGEDPLVRPRIVSPLELAVLNSLDSYAAILLVDVPALSDKAARAVAEYVHRGGGLLVAQGDAAESGFYNDWRLKGEPVIPATTGSLKAPKGEEILRPAPDGFTHPALILLREDPMDLGNSVISAYRSLEVREGSEGWVGARLTNGDPLLVTRSLGEGRVAQFAAGLDLSAGNLPTTRAFVVLLHQLVHHLADTNGQGLNPLHRPGAALSLRNIARAAGETGEAGLVEALGEERKTLTVFTALGEEKKARLRKGGDLLLDIPPDLAPGVHFLGIPESLREPLAPLPGEDHRLPFALVRDIEERPISPLTERDSGVLRRYLLWREAQSGEKLMSALTGKRFGTELWRPLALLAFLLVIGEIALTRWVAVRRRTGTTLQADFEERNNPGERFEAHLASMKASTRSEKGS